MEASQGLGPNLEKVAGGQKGGAQKGGAQKGGAQKGGAQKGGLAPLSCEAPAAPNRQGFTRQPDTKTSLALTLVNRQV